MPFPLSIIPREEYKDHPLLTRLLELHDMPANLYIAGTLPEVTLDEYGRATPRILTVVGSRKYTTYGKLALEKLLSELAGEDVVILSGLALGIDGIAHEAALKHNLVTVAIPGSGLDTKVLYPKTHLPLAEAIVEAGGGVVSEFPAEMEAAQWTFPARNRVMAALADAVLVIEATEKSGTLITARQALELGRDIGAIPGDIFSDSSQGTNMLIKEGAYMIRNADDLFDLLHLQKKSHVEVTHDLTESEKKILDQLFEPTEKDTLLMRSDMPADQFLMTLSSLEMKGCIQETFGEVRKVV
ncbi:MAG: DNA-processing protein DprA [Candidatus Paceibacterota bacterium]